MSTNVPQVTRVYQNHHLDSTRWKRFMPRDDDIILTTSYKSGTTWTQAILKHMLVPNYDSSDIYDFSPWLGSRWHDPHQRIAHIESQTHRRCIKSHLAFDGLPYYPQVKYIVVARDARDVFMSFWNHYSNYTDQFYARLNAPEGLVGDPIERCPDDIHLVWRRWITEGWFEWEQEGYPFWGNMHHTQTYWDYKHLPNLLFVHYNNLLKDPFAQIKRIAEYIELDITDERITEIVDLTSFQSMKKNSDQLVGESPDFKGGSKTFINKGTNGRWKDVLSEEELALYTETVKRVLSVDCAQWLETGV